MAPVAAVLTVASGLFMGAQSYFGGKAEQKAYDQQAAEARRLGREESSRIQAESRRINAAQRAMFGASGASMGGSVMDLQLDSIFMANADATEALRQGEFQRAQFKTQGNFAYTKGLQGAMNSVIGGAAGGAGYMAKAPTAGGVKTSADGSYGGSSGSSWFPKWK